MKKQIQIIAVCLLGALSSCHTSSSSSTTATPASTVNITINGHTYHVSGTTAGIAAITSSNLSRIGTGAYSTMGNVFNVTVQGQSNQVLFAIGGSKFDLSTAIGTYHTGTYSDANGTMTLGSVEITDYGDGGKQYGTFLTGNTSCTDTTSSLTVTVSNGSEVKGTFSLKVTYNGAVVPITGDFDYIH